MTRFVRNQWERRIIASSGLFDAHYYLKEYADIRKAKVEPLSHFVTNGWRELRNPCACFDTEFYLQKNPDVQNVKINPLVHFIRNGYAEGRDPCENFDHEQFLNQYPSFRRITRKKVLPGKPAADLESIEPSTSARTHVQISILIPLFNALEYTKGCLEALVEDFDFNQNEIILVNNGSTDGTNAWLNFYLNKHPQIKLIQNTTNRGFAPAINQAIFASKGEKVVILNNDTIPAKGWLDCLSEALDKNLDLGIVSPVTNYVGEGSQIEPEAKDLNPLNVNSFASSIYCRKEIEIVSNRLVFFCVMIRREVIDLIGGLDEGYVRGNFEDDDYCLRTILSGYKLGIAKGAFVYHHGSATFKSNNLDYTKYFEENRVRFYTKVSRLSANSPLTSPGATVDKPFASVILRTVNRPETLINALNSLANQTEKNFEVVLVNDGGPELSGLLEPYLGVLNINYVHHEKQQGRTPALNSGVRSASGEWICFLDDDDIFYPWYFSTMLKNVLIRHDSKFLFARAMRSVIDVDISSRSPLEIKNFPIIPFSRERLLISNSIPINTWFIKRQLINLLGGFDESFDTLEDYEFLIRVTGSVEPVSLETIVSEYRFYLSVSNSMSRSRKDSRIALTRIYERFPVNSEAEKEERKQTLINHKKQEEAINFLVGSHLQDGDYVSKDKAREILKIIGAI